MAGRYKAYPEYKTSNHEWLGKVPSHWNVFSAKRIFASIRKPALESDEQLAASQKYGIIPQSLMMKLNDSKVVLALKGTSSFRHVEKNNFVISLRSFEGGIEHSHYDGCVSPAYTVLKPTLEMNYPYYKYLLKCSPLIAALQSSTDSLREGKSISYDNFGTIFLPYTSAKEQQKIANFLDHETAKIDTLIAKQEKLIELLKEKCQAVISHAVTKGLNSNAPMKDSGVEWLGEVPEHWEIKRIKHCASLISSKQKIDNQLVIALENIEGLTGHFVSTNSNYNGEDVAFIEGDILFGKLRPYLAKVFLCQKSGVAFGDILTYRPNQQIESSFLFYTMISSWFIEIVDSSTYGAKMPRASSEFVNEMFVATPPLQEQILISKELDITLLHFKELTDKANRAIKLMNERKTALISATVTGKIDVRDWKGDC